MPYFYPFAFTLLVWWLSTGAILYLDGLPRRTHRWSFMGATALLAVALYGVAITRDDTSIFGAYAAFASSIAAWGWQETGFLMGFITGPRRTGCPAGCRGWQRFKFAFQAILYHEFAIVALGIVMLALSWGSQNQVATGTYFILWIMRVSAKLNVFLGVRNLYEAFLPDHLRYLTSYFRRQRMNALFPLSVVASTIGAVLLWRSALADDASAFGLTQATLLATILTLAVLEHWFLVVPLPADALWRWGLRSREAKAAATPTSSFASKASADRIAFAVSEIESVPRRP
jgi:putative photosynthetic complex assembly protein 2